MSQATVVVPCEVEAHLAVRRAAKQLCAHGYEIEKHAGGEAVCELRYVKGAANAIHTHDYKHHLKLSSDGHELTFVFTAGMAGSGFVTKNERAVLEERARAAVAATTVEEAIPKRVSCRQCGQLTATEAKTCAACGSPDYF